jgi:uncharacterized protein
MQYFAPSIDLPATIEEAFAYHGRPGALSRLIPPWEPVSVESSDGSLHAGSRVVLKMNALGLPMRWVAEHTVYSPPELFVDVQKSGPFRHWEHRHQFSVVEGDSHGAKSRLVDSISYQLPLGRVGAFFGGSTIRRQLGAMFQYRHAVTAGDLGAIVRAGLAPMTVGISGASGLVGKGLTSFLGLAGHQVARLVRGRANNPEEIFAWGDANDRAPLERLDAVIHLAGESIAAGRWNDGVKQRIRDSRVVKTRQLCESLASLAKPPKTLLCASATGIYGNRGDAVLGEMSSAGDDFLARVAHEWEEACSPAVAAGIRVVHLRFGIILSPQGGALKKMLLPAKLGIGGPLGGGSQWWSWMAIDDVLRATYHCLANEDVSGPVNFVSPNAVRNSDFAKVLGRVLRRPSLIPTPKLALRLVLGEMADALLLASTRVVPTALLDSGFQFQFPDLESALRHSLGRFEAGAK